MVKKNYKGKKWSYDDKMTRVKSFSGGYEKDSWRGENPTNK